MKLKFKLAAGVVSTLMSVGTAAAAVSYTPGTYEGEAIGRNGPVKVQVTVAKDRIESIRVVSHNESAGLSDAPINTLPKTIVDKQSLAVDVFSGATFSSKAVIGAVENALKKATKDIKPLLIAPAVTAAVKPPKDETVDVLVVGSGISGMVAGITAAEKGSNVLIIEKQGMLGAGDSMNISTGITAGGSRLIKQLGIENATAKDYADFLVKQAATKKVPINEKNVRTYAMRGGELVDWLMDLGVPFGRFQKDKWFHITKDGSAPGPHIVRALSKKIADDNINYRLNSQVVDLLMKDGKVVGATVKTGAGSYKVNAKAVVMATGGFSASHELVKKWAPEWVGRPTTGAVSLTGDGILMAQKVGAQTVAMQEIKANYLCHPLTARDGVSLTAITPYNILINHEGKRFVDEGHASINFKSRAMMKQTGHEAYAIVDQTAMDNLKLMRNYAAAGYFVKANTVEELASKLKVDQKAFIKTMKDYMAACQAGKDPEFNRRIQYPIAKAPFYAALVTPSMQSTYGGIKTDEKAQALNADNKPIAGLYAAGATSGHEAYANEVGFAAIIGLVYGKIAGENAAAYAKAQK
jgi:fumarate reductase flavoprotein subunit